jgi:membrane-bound inhibitor of C-type lysozyme
MERHIRTGKHSDADQTKKGGLFMKINNKALLLFIFAFTLGVAQFRGTEALAEPTYYAAQGCAGCHTAPVVATCNGCHHHGPVSLKGVTNKTSYAPGESVTVTMTGGSKTGWFGAKLYDQNTVELARSTGNDSGMGWSATYPVTLTAPAPTTPGTYSWKVAWYGNQYDTSSLGSAWVPDATNPNHGEVRVSINSFTVAAATPPADTTAPVVGVFTLPATATSLTVPVSSLTATDNVAVTGYMVTTSATKPAASAAGWSATAPASVTAPAAGSVTFYAWAKDAAGNVSLSKSASVTVTVSTTDTTKPTLSISALANGASTNKTTLNISGNASDAGGLQSVTVNGQVVVVNPDGSFSYALTLAAGANTVTVIAIDKAGNQQTDTRTITYDATAPVLTVSAPADNSSSAQSFITLTGTINENSTVTVTDNNGSPQSASIVGSNFSATINLVPGINTIVITATDLAGNTTSAKRTVTYNGSKLTLAVTNPNQDITTSKSRLVLTGTVVDTVSKATVRISMSGRTYTPRVTNGAFSQTLTFTKAKQYAITITARDSAGNSSSITRNVIYKPAVTDGNDD